MRRCICTSLVCSYPDIQLVIYVPVCTYTAMNTIARTFTVCARFGATVQQPQPSHGANMRIFSWSFRRGFNKENGLSNQGF